MQGIANLISGAVAPIQQEVAGLKTEVETQKQLRQHGVKPTAWGGGQPPADNPASGDPEEKPLNFSEMSPRALISMGRKKMHGQPAS